MNDLATPTPAPRAAIERVAPLGLAVAIAIAHGVAWSLGGLKAWVVLCVVTTLSATASAWLLGRRGRLLELLRPKQGDLAVGAVAALATMALLYGVARLGFRIAPARTAEDLRAILRVVVALDRPYLPAIGLAAMAPLDELIWRGALHETLDDVRRGWLPAIAGPLLFAVSTIPSRHPGLVVAALVVGCVCQLLRSTSERLFSAIAAHVFFGWLAATWLLPELWALAQ